MPRAFPSFSGFQVKGFIAGIAGGVTALALLGGALGINSTASLENLQSHMAAKLVIIQKPGFPAAPDSERAVESVPAEPPGHTSAEKHPKTATTTAHENSHEDIAASVKAPLPGLTEKSPLGPIPVIRKSDGMTSFKAYKRPYKKSENLPRIAVVVTEYGLREAYSAQALTLPADVTLLASPYATHGKAWQKKALDSGRELWLEMPMESGSYSDSDPGPRALSSTLNLSDNELRLHGILTQGTGYTGVAAFLTNRFKAETLMVQSLADQLFKRGLGYFELNPAAPDFVSEQARRSHGPYIRNTINLADSRFAKDISSAFEIAESRALEHKPVVILAPPYPAMMEAIKKWEDTLPAKGISLAPLSALASPSSGASP